MNHIHEPYSWTGKQRTTADHQSVARSWYTKLPRIHSPAVQTRRGMDGDRYHPRYTATIHLHISYKKPHSPSAKRELRRDDSNCHDIYNLWLIVIFPIAPRHSDILRSTPSGAGCTRPKRCRVGHYDIELPVFSWPNHETKLMKNNRLSVPGKLDLLKPYDNWGSSLFSLLLTQRGSPLTHTASQTLSNRKIH